MTNTQEVVTADEALLRVAERARRDRLEIARLEGERVEAQKRVDFIADRLMVMRDQLKAINVALLQLSGAEGYDSRTDRVKPVVPAEVLVSLGLKP